MVKKINKTVEKPMKKCGTSKKRVGTTKKNLVYAQSGGVTGVINNTARGVIETARKNKRCIDKTFIGRHGIQGILLEELYDINQETPSAIKGLYYRPGGAFGSCRYKLTDFDKNPREYERLVEVFKAHNIGYFLYNGGNDSADTTHKIAQISKNLGFPVTCIGIPKTMDNDLPVTDCCPGYGSVAKFIATATKETGVDIASMAPATQIFILEVMGRHAGWISAASSLARQKPNDPPHIILCPEVLFDSKKFLQRVDQCVKKYGYCSIVTSESLRDLNGKHIAETGQKDAFGHMQLGCLAPILANMIKDRFGYQYHCSVADYIQRASRHLGAKVDLEQAYAVGEAAVEFAVAGKNDICPIIVRKPGKTYRWTIGETALTKIANTEKNLPRSFITKDGMWVTKRCVDYIRPLIQGEDFPPFKNGVPHYVELKLKLIKKKLPAFKLHD